MYTLKSKQQANFRDRGSKFIGYLFPCQTEEQFNTELDALKSTYPDATHHCYGWRLNPGQVKEYSSDDGEPSGSAGLPILNQLKSYDVVNAGLVVVRYYGGTKLGKSGLIQAYGQTARLCLGQAGLVRIQPVRLFKLEYPYPEENRVNKLKNDFKLSVMNADYMEEVTLTLACPLDSAGKMEKELAGLEHLGISFEKLEGRFIAG